MSNNAKSENLSCKKKDGACEGFVTHIAESAITGCLTLTKQNIDISATTENILKQTQADAKRIDYLFSSDDDASVKKQNNELLKEAIEDEQKHQEQAAERAIKIMKHQFIYNLPYVAITGLTIITAGGIVWHYIDRKYPANNQAFTQRAT